MKTHTTARNFVIQLGSIVSLYIVLTAAITLLFASIDMVFPDAVDYYAYESNAESIRFSIAALVVFLPTYLGLMRFINTIRRTETEGDYINLAQWLI